MVFVGIVGNAMLGIVDLELMGTSFEEGVVLYIVYGTVLAVMGGLTFWAPKLWGRVLPEGAAIGLALVGVAATVLAALPLYIAGFLEQPGGFPASDAEVGRLLAIDGVESGQLWMILSVVGHALMALTVVAFVGLLFKAFGTGGDAHVADNPFHAHTIEWATTSPAPARNFADVPVVESPEPLFVQATSSDEGSSS
jgi:heme/copper-type cytochrome/quinol oxidase subunit 1